MFLDLLKRSLEDVVEELIYPAKTLSEIYSFNEKQMSDVNLVEEIARSLGIENSSDLKEVVRRVLEERK